MTNTILTGILILLSIASGIWLSRKGRPLHAIIFGVHKIISLAAIVWIAIVLFRYFKETGFQLSENSIPLVLGASALFALLSGVFLSFEKPWIPYYKWTHGIASALIVISAVFMYLG